MVQTLRDLRDVEGVIGSFVVAADGRVQAHDCPSIFDAESLHEAGKRLVHLREAIDLADNPLDYGLFDYTDQRLLLRSAGPDILIVLTRRDVNLGALKMGANLLVKRLARLRKAGEHRSSDPQLAERESYPPIISEIPAPPSAISAVPVAAVAQRASHPPGMSVDRSSAAPRVYRGIRIG